MPVCKGETKALTAFDNAVVDAGISKESAIICNRLDNSIPGITVPREEIIRWAYNNKLSWKMYLPAFVMRCCICGCSIKEYKGKKELYA